MRMSIDNVDLLKCQQRLCTWKGNTGNVRLLKAQYCLLSSASSTSSLKHQKTRWMMLAFDVMKIGACSSLFPRSCPILGNRLTGPRHNVEGQSSPFNAVLNVNLSSSVLAS